MPNKPPNDEAVVLAEGAPKTSAELVTAVVLVAVVEATLAVLAAATATVEAGAEAPPSSTSAAEDPALSRRAAPFEVEGPVLLAGVGGGTSEDKLAPVFLAGVASTRGDKLAPVLLAGMPVFLAGVGSTREDTIRCCSLSNLGFLAPSTGCCGSWLLLLPAPADASSACGSSSSSLSLMATGLAEAGRFAGEAAADGLCSS